MHRRPHRCSHRRPAAWLVALALLAWAGAASPARAAERILRFDARIHVQPDSALVVTEDVLYDFGGAQRHGIYRDIPVRYARRGEPDHSIVLEILEVTDERGHARPWRASGRGAWRRVRIGSPDRTVTGQQHYRIRYRARLAMVHLDAHDEVYWNVTGNGWEVPIEAASAEVFLPSGAGRILDVACFTGATGSTLSRCSAIEEVGSARFETTARLAPGEGLTIAVALPKHTVREPTSSERLRARLAPLLSAWLLLPIATVLGTFGWWRRAGRDHGASGAIPVRYEPPEGLEPAEVGTLVDERADLDDVTATILQLAVRGYLTIHELEGTQFLFFSRKDYRLEKRRAPEGLKDHQVKLMQALFSGRDQVLVSSLKNEFYEDLPGIRRALYDQLSGPGKHFAGRPDRVRNVWLGVGIAIAVVGLPAFSASSVAGGCILVSGLVIAAFSRVMPRRTRKGRRAYEEILGFREFLGRVDRDRIERMGASTREQFEKILPYALVLGMADAWADAFAEIYTEPPEWYHGYHPTGVFRPHVFVSDMGRSLDSIGQTLASRPSSGGSGSGFGGGGFSGGGFGGGGGGSW